MGERRKARRRSVNRAEAFAREFGRGLPMKNFIVCFAMLIIVLAVAGFVVHVRGHAVENYVCTAPAGTTLQAEVTGMSIDYPRRVATLAGGGDAGTYAAIAVTDDEVNWAARDEFTFNRHTMRLTVAHNEQNVVSMKSTQCAPKGWYDRLVTMVD